MLTDFFKKREESDCKCNIVKYVDRIWLDEKGTATFFRKFVLTVSKESAVSLTEIKMLIPAQYVLDIKSFNHTCFEENYYFNSQHIRTTGNYNIKKKPDPLTYSSYGIIDDDGIENIKVYIGDRAQPRCITLGKCTFIQFEFPEPIKPGESIESRISFQIASLFDNMTPNEEIPTYYLELSYFSPFLKDEIELLGDSSQIGIIPILPGEKHPGGFDIWLYLPPNFTILFGFTGSSVKKDNLSMNGTKGDQKTKLGWRLRYLLKNISYPEDTIVTSKLNLNFDLNGQIKQRHNNTKQLFEISQNVKPVPLMELEIKKIKREVKTGTKIAIFALIFSLLIPLLIELIKKYC